MRGGFLLIRVPPLTQIPHFPLELLAWQDPGAYSGRLKQPPGTNPGALQHHSGTDSEQVQLEVADRRNLALRAGIRALKRV